jgi:surface antigen
LKPLLLAASLAALCLTGLAAAPHALAGMAQESPADEAARLKAESDARWQRLQAQNRANDAARRAEQARYEQSLRDAAAARARYEADVRAAQAARLKYEADLARSNRQRAEYERRLAEHEAREAARADRRRPAPAAEAAPAPSRAQATGERTCAQRRDRSRRRGRGIGSVVGGIAGGLIGGPAGGVANMVTSVLPVGALIGEAIASLLDCEEQQQAANATEQAVRGSVGTTATWTSETRANVSGSSTVTAAEPLAPDGAQCLFVTDIVIVDGEETRAPKRMCRRPPANRFVRV